MKRKILAVSLVVIVVATLALGSLAFFNDEATAHNVITTSGVDIVLTEYADEACTTPFTNGQSGIMPDATVDKYAKIALAENSADAWIRVKFTKSIAFDKANEAAEGKTPNPDLLILNRPDGWTDGGDGWYYYNKPLTKAEPTAMALNSVYFDKTMGNEYQNATANVTITVQAVQTAHNGASAQEASGWPEENK